MKCLTAGDKRVLVAIARYGAIDPLRWAETTTGFDPTWDAFFRISRLPDDTDTVYDALNRLRPEGWLADYEDDDVRLSAWAWAELVKGQSVPDAAAILEGQVTEKLLTLLIEKIAAEVQKGEK